MPRFAVAWIDLPCFRRCCPTVRWCSTRCWPTKRPATCRTTRSAPAIWLGPVTPACGSTASTKRSSWSGRRDRRHIRSSGGQPGCSSCSRGRLADIGPTSGSPVAPERPTGTTKPGRSTSVTARSSRTDSPTATSATTSTSASASTVPRRAPPAPARDSHTDSRQMSTGQANAEA